MKTTKKTFIMKKFVKNVNEIETFHHFLNVELSKKILTITYVKNTGVNFIIISTRIKALHKTLMKLTPGVNFINVLQAALTHADPESAKKKTDNLTVFFSLSGSVQAKLFIELC
jgi:hypothetical protein